MNVWQFARDSVQAPLAGGRLLLDPQHPTDGIAIAGADGQRRQLLTIDCQPPHQFQLEELFARQQDLVVRYRQSSTDACAVEFDWRMVNDEQLVPPSAGAIEWRISIQTTLLDSSPAILCPLAADVQWNRIRLGDLLPAPGDGLEAGVVPLDAEVMWLGQVGPVAVAIMVGPNDLAQIAAGATEADLRPVTLRVFGQFLEKGVIRWARMRLYLYPTLPSREQLGAAYLALAHSPLPLTA
ncbi:MAG: hypothetical protein KatS3mg111_0311 [Pirellulaceae bacterium]|nr:MAG: hypothetical protein KatS3mg111_0311 [Pirellulaceae bacterium]